MALPSISDAGTFAFLKKYFLLLTPWFSEVLTNPLFFKCMNVLNSSPVLSLPFNRYELFLPHLLKLDSLYNPTFYLSLINCFLLVLISSLNLSCLQGSPVLVIAFCPQFFIATVNDFWAKSPGFCSRLTYWGEGTQFGSFYTYEV